MSNIQPETIDSLVKTRLEDWRRHLIDLSFRNRLINYKPTKNTTLRIRTPSIHELLTDPDRRKPFNFFFPPNLEEDEVVPSTAAEPDEVVTDLDDPERLKTVLSNLARRSDAEYQNKAIRILYVAAAFLKWEDPVRRDQLRSPLFLIPVELRRESSRDRYRLFFITDEEIVVNPALTVKLEKDIGLHIPENWAWEDKSSVQELDEIREAIAETNWTVDESVVLGLFSFQKLVMYRDLQRNEAKVSGHPLVRALATGDGSGFHEASQGIPTEAELDSVQDPHASFSILDADASQRRCIEAAKQGKSFVMQGPPGTGKSQTIANIIAEALGQGKRVLFISEKIAALQVVHKRLSDAGLGEFCLPLHGRDAVRKRVVEALDESLTHRARPREGLSPFEFSRLITLRAQLNEAVELLHLPREVLAGKSPRQVYEELAPLYDAPVVAEAMVASDRQGEDARRELESLRGLFNLVAQDWDVVTRHEFIWRGYRSTRFDEMDRSRLLAKVNQLEQTGRQLILAAEAVTLGLGLDWDVSVANARKLGRIGELLGRKPSLETHWLRRDALPGLREASTAARDAYHELEQTRRSFAMIYPHRDPSEFAPNIDSQLVDALAGLRGSIGRGAAWESELLDRVAVLNELASRADSGLHDLESEGRRLFDSLGQPWCDPSPTRIARVVGIADLAFKATERPESRWLVSSGIEVARSTLESCQALISDYKTSLAQIRKSYKDGVLELDAESMLERVTTAQGKFMGTLGRPYRADIKKLRCLRKDGRAPHDPREDLREILKLGQLGSQLDAHQSEYETALGHWYTGRETNVDALRRALIVAEEARGAMAEDTDIERLATCLCVGSRPDTQLAQSASKIGAELERIRAGSQHIEVLGDRPELSSLTQLSLSRLQKLLGELRAPVAQLLDIVRVLQQGRANQSGDLSRLEEDTSTICTLLRQEAVIASRRPQWDETIGAPFHGGETDWGALEGAYDWLDQLFASLEGELPLQLKERVCTAGDVLPFEELATAVDAFTVASEAFSELFDPVRSDELREASKHHATSEVIELAVQMREHIDDLVAWTNFRRVSEEIHGLEWGRFLGLLVAELVPSGQVVPAFLRAYWNSRLDRAFEENQSLAKFSGLWRRKLIEEFVELDEKLITAAADRVIAACNSKRPEPLAMPGSEVGLLKREAGKKKRHMSVRRLLSTLPNLLSALKPCLMMSPLTVSDYLSPVHHFDLVIFDEASQVPPWDAINCIYRADQLIAAGDDKQLPPTPFFQQADPDADGFDEEVEGTEEVMESILDACKVLLPTEPLRWHYRSRHESLISFSNHHFYNNKLVTFPAPVRSSKKLGVRLVYVEDGIYDRARSQTNRVEARRVAELVVDHLREMPEQTIGVVAFSVSQTEAINDELDALRADFPDLDQRFVADRLNGVFVKNLESVQGDERDVIIFSVGYGYDQHHKFYQGFGPLNKDGGHRRLNVAVTRARDQVIVVASVRYTDFNLADNAAPGAQRLRDYLEFAEKGPDALRSEIESIGGEYESPFEESVAEAVRDLGYQVVPQVGVGGYRIDLGVVDPGTLQRFALGIECDGATYHSTPTARDRDRLRQEILEDLGWRIHRIWSRDWVRERSKETERLREAIVAAVDSGKVSVAGRPRKNSMSERVARAHEVEELYELHGSDDALALPWTIRYKLANLAPFYSEYDFHALECREYLRAALKKLITVEAPISIDRATRALAASQGMRRCGSRVVETVQKVIADVIRQGDAKCREDFLWRPGWVLEVVRVPDPEDSETQRSIEDIPAEELDLAIIKLRETSGVDDHDTLISHTARIFGFSRTGPAIRKRLESRVAALMP